MCRSVRFDLDRTQTVYYEIPKKHKLLPVSTIYQNSKKQRDVKSEGDVPPASTVCLNACR